MLKAPEYLTTQRLILRRPTAGDAEAVFARYASDAEVTRYLAWPTHKSIADTEAFIAFSDGEWMRWPAGPYLIELRASKSLIGSTGLAFETAERASTGYVLAREAWGNGYAAEAVQALIRIAPALGLGVVYALIHAEHRTSQRVLESSGFERDAQQPQLFHFPNHEPPGPHPVVRFERNIT